MDRFSKYYEETDSRPVFETVDKMLKWAGLFNLTTRTLLDELVDVGLSPLLINELVTVITRINYGQSVYMSGLGGAVSLAGSGGGLWAYLLSTNLHNGVRTPPFVCISISFLFFLFYYLFQFNCSFF